MAGRGRPGNRGSWRPRPSDDGATGKARIQDGRTARGRAASASQGPGHWPSGVRRSALARRRGNLAPQLLVLLARSSRGGGHFSIRGGKESLPSAPLFPRHTRRFRTSPRDPAARGAGSRLPAGLCSSAAVPPWLTGPAGPHAAFVRVGFRLDSACRWLCWQ